MTTAPETAPQSDTVALWGVITELQGSVSRLEGSVGRLEGAVAALIEGQRQLIEGQRELQRQLVEGQNQINQRIDRVIVVSVTAGATLTDAMIGGGLEAIAIRG